MRKNCEKWSNIQEPPKGSSFICACGLRVPLPGFLNVHSRSISKFRLTTREGDPRALGRSAGLRETARGSWHKKSSQNLPRTFQNPSKDFPEPPQHLSKINPKGLLDLILDLCLKKIGFRTAKKQCQPSLKWSPRRSQIHSLRLFVVFFFPLKICPDFSLIFCWFSVTFQEPNVCKIQVFPWENAIFYKIGIFKTN